MLSNDEEQALRLVLSHEYRRCDQAFLDFSESQAHQLGLGPSKQRSLATYDSYARFLHHLYEFYSGVFKLSRGSLKNIKHDELDKLINAEAEKVMGLRRWRIERGDADSSENDLSYYQVSVPQSFGTDFRQCRNRVAHADLRRSGLNGSLTLPDFFENYDKFIKVLYEEPYWLWHLDSESYDWGEIEAFNSKLCKEISLITKNSFLAKISNWILYKQISKALSTRRKHGS